MNDIRRKYNPIVDLSKFTSNKKILSGIVTLVYKIIKKKKNLKSLLPNFVQNLWLPWTHCGAIPIKNSTKKKKTNIFLDR